ncbi:MAG: hypothetical protein RR696_14135, partial [Clostridia bacterium]
MDELELPRQAFESVIPEIPQEQSFITQDEIDGTLVSRYAYSEGNLRIHAFFQSNHTQAEKVAFIKNQYGIGGCSHALSGASGSWMDYDGKGLRLRKNGCEDVSLQWNTVVKRIDDLIAHGRYLSKADLQKIDAERKAEPTVAIAAQESVEETAASTQETSSTDTPDEMSEFFAIDTEKVREGLAARGIVGGMLVDPEKLANDPLIQMVEEDAERIAAVNSAPYAVGDTLYLEEGKPFIVEHIGDLDVRLRDPSLHYPIARAESKENLARLLERYPQAAHSAPDIRETVQQPVRSETVAVYPAEENHLPYDVVIERMHVDTPEQAIVQTDHTPVPEIQPTAENFHITDEHLGEGGAKAKYGWNVEAIRT